MNKNVLLFIILFFLTGFRSQETCQYQESYRKVVISKKNNSFKYELINLGEFSLNMEISNCQINGSELNLEGKATYPKSVNGKVVFEEDSVEILLCKPRGKKCLKVIKTLAMSDKEGHFKISIPHYSDNILVLYKANRNSIAFKGKGFKSM